MRIISGIYRGKAIHPPKFFHDRPTTDFAKESLFTIILGNFLKEFENMKILDLFAGTGSISYEFASRGCKNITATDNNFRYTGFIKKTAAELDFSQISVVHADAFRFLKTVKTKYDIIFADPPFGLTDSETIPEIIHDRCLLENNGWLIIEHSEKTDLSQLTGFTEKRRYGNVNFSFFSY